MELKLLQENVNEGTSSNRSYCGNQISLFVDSETGVQYFIINHGHANAICPRYDKDGKPMCMIIK